MKENKFYVYGLFEPIYNGFDDCFYIGKGCDHRIEKHFWDCNLNVNDCRNPHKVRKILKIKQDGKDPQSHKIYTGLSEQKALELEEFLISEIGFNKLTNILESHIPLGGEKHPNYGKRLSSQIRQDIAESNSSLSREEVSEIKWCWENTKMTHKEISSFYDNCDVSNIVHENTWVFIEDLKKPEWFSRKIEEEIINKRCSFKLSIKEVKEIKWLLENSKLSIREISEKYDVSESHISHINVGRSYDIISNAKPNWYSEYKENKIVNSRRRRSGGFSLKEIKEIKWLLDNTDLYQKEIAKKYSTKGSAISSIKNENTWGDIEKKEEPNWYSKEKEKVILDNRSGLSKDDVKEIKWLLDNSNMTQQKISKRYDVSTSSINNINVGNTWNKLEGRKKPNWYC